MKTDWTHLEPWRVEGPAGQTFGKFHTTRNGCHAIMIAVDGTETGWEHVSLSLRPINHPGWALPSWADMCWLKDLFWDPEECVLQFHPPESKHINIGPGVLHLWRPTKEAIPMPPILLV